MKIIKYIFCCGLPLAISACTSVMTTPTIGNMQTVIANANNENAAVKIATDRAQRICTLENKTAKIVDLDTVYQGLDASQKTLAKIAKAILPEEKTPSPYTPDGFTYKVTLTFKCI